MQRHRLPASFSNVIGEPGHTKPQAAKLRHGVSYCGCMECVLLSTWIEGLPAPRKIGNLRYQYSRRDRKHRFHRWK